MRSLDYLPSRDPLATLAAARALAGRLGWGVPKIGTGVDRGLERAPWFPIRLEIGQFIAVGGLPTGWVSWCVGESGGVALPTPEAALQHALKRAARHPLATVILADVREVAPSVEVPPLED